MKYFLDTEFIEGTQKKLFGNTKPTIDLISIGIVSEDGREYYAISKEFNLKEAWNRYEIRYASGDQKNIFPNGYKYYWIREHILKPIWKDLVTLYEDEYMFPDEHYSFSYSSLKELLKMYGKSNKEIAKEVIEFVEERSDGKIPIEILGVKTSIEFYGYYCDYDWVVFCWLFGKMIDLPKGFPMYCKDLKQLQDEHFIINKEVVDYIDACKDTKDYPTLEKLKYIFNYEDIKKHSKYPKQINEHSALDDARWNYQLYKFLENV